MISDLAPAWLAWVHQLKVDRCDAKKSDDSWFLPIRLYAVVMRRVSDAPDKSASWRLLAASAGSERRFSLEGRRAQATLAFEASTPASGLAR